MSKMVVKKPPMGWNSFDCFGWSVTEKEFKKNVDYMEMHLKKYGWEYAVVDFCWYTPGCNSEPNPSQDDSFRPWLNMDSYGRLRPDPVRFPSSENSGGFLPLSKYVHDKGLKFGIHVMRGIPRQAVQENTPIKGCAYHARDIADTTSTCGWLNYMYGINMDHPGAQFYLDSLMELYAEWEVDFVKIDDLSYPYHGREIEGYAAAIENSGRPIVFSTSPGETPLDEAEHIKEYANMWRISQDFWDNWEALLKQFKRLKDWSTYREESSWPDADMLPIGHISLRGPVEEPRYSNFTFAEQRTMLTLWSMAKSPLMIGANLPDNRPEDLKMVTNPIIIDIDQNSTNNREVFRDDNLIVWAAESQDTTKRYIALFNIGDMEREVKFDLHTILPEEPKNVQEVWGDHTFQLEQAELLVKIPAHDVKLFYAFE